MTYDCSQVWVISNQVNVTESTVGNSSPWRPYFQAVVCPGNRVLFGFPGNFHVKQHFHDLTILDSLLYTAWCISALNNSICQCILHLIMEYSYLNLSGPLYLELSLSWTSSSVFPLQLIIIGSIHGQFVKCTLCILFKFQPGPFTVIQSSVQNIPSEIA